jgi:hypothetical protein
MKFLMCRLLMMCRRFRRVRRRKCGSGDLGVSMMILYEFTWNWGPILIVLF